MQCSARSWVRVVVAGCVLVGAAAGCGDVETRGGPPAPDVAADGSTRVDGALDAQARPLDARGRPDGLSSPADVRESPTDGPPRDGARVDSAVADTAVGDAIRVDAVVGDGRADVPHRPTDAAQADSATADARLRDARPTDSGALDGARTQDAAIDGATPDGATPDAAAPDGAAMPDAELPDALRSPYHPVGYWLSPFHAPELKTGLVDCRRCHGDQLEGARGPTCDICHPRGWQSQCTFCHGGSETETGAPPRGLRGELAAELLRFRSHTAHVTATANHPAFDCVECHLKPESVLSVGHVFDATPGTPEVDFNHGLSRQGVNPAPDTCNSVYCHGTGRVPGNVGPAPPPMTCDTCHPTAGLAGSHALHLQQALATCDECHAATVSAPGVISDPARHVNGVVDVELADPGMMLMPGMCSGACHDHVHQNGIW